MYPTRTGSRVARGAAALLVSLSCAAPAWAGDWWLESADRVERMDAARVEAAATTAGFDARVVRRFVDGSGWVYLARVEGFADGASAEVAADQLSRATGVALTVLASDGNAVQVVRTIDRPAAGAQPDPAPGPDDVDALFASVIAAHGTREPVADAIRRGPTRFEFRRTLPDGRVIDHVWGNQPGDAVYAEISGSGGAVRPSRTKIASGRASMSVNGEAWRAQDVPRTQAVLDDLSPMEVIPFVLDVEAVIGARREFEQMAITGAGDVDGVDTVVVRFGGDTTSGAIELEIGRKDHLVRRINLDDGGLVRDFGDYRAVKVRDGSVSVPYAIVTLRDGVEVDRVAVKTFEVGGALPPAWFASGDR